MTTKHYNWATLGTGVIANELAQALEQQGRKLYSVANRTYDKGLAFAEKYGIDKLIETDNAIKEENAKKLAEEQEKQLSTEQSIEVKVEEVK